MDGFSIVFLAAAAVGAVVLIAGYVIGTAG